MVRDFQTLRRCYARETIQITSQVNDQEIRITNYFHPIGDRSKILERECLYPFEMLFVLEICKRFRKAIVENRGAAQVIGQVENYQMIPRRRMNELILDA